MIFFHGRRLPHIIILLYNNKSARNFSGMKKIYKKIGIQRIISYLCIRDDNRMTLRDRPPGG